MEPTGSLPHSQVPVAIVYT